MMTWSLGWAVSASYHTSFFFFFFFFFLFHYSFHFFIHFFISFLYLIILFHHFVSSFYSYQRYWHRSSHACRGSGQRRLFYVQYPKSLLRGEREREGGWGRWEWKYESRKWEWDGKKTETNRSDESEILSEQAKPAEEEGRVWLHDHHREIAPQHRV